MQACMSHVRSSVLFSRAFWHAMHVARLRVRACTHAATGVRTQKQLFELRLRDAQRRGAKLFAVRCQQRLRVNCTDSECTRTQACTHTLGGGQ